MEFWKAIASGKPINFNPLSCYNFPKVEENP